MDVHDVGQYRLKGGEWRRLAPGMILTVEPGLYLPAGTEGLPARYADIGVRIEDDVLVTADGCKNLSDGLPRSSDDVETWLAAQREAGPRLPG